MQNAPTLKIKLQEFVDSIILTDATGAFSPRNEGGFGGKNYDISDFFKAQFEIYPPNKSVPIIFDVSASLPSKTNRPTQIFALDLGMKRMQSGRWKIGYRLQGSIGTSAYTEQFFILIKTVQAAVDKSIVNSLAHSPDSNEFRQANTYRDLMINASWAANCGMPTVANNILTYLTAQTRCVL